MQTDVFTKVDLLQKEINSHKPLSRIFLIDALEKAHVDDEDFVYFIARMVRETQKDYLRLFLR